MHWCYGENCGAERREYQFLDETITAVHAGRIDNIDQLCVRCKLLEGQLNVTYDTAKMYECTRCHAHKGLKEFSPADLKDWLRGHRHYDRWACYECRYPLCKLCVESGDPMLQHRRPRDAVQADALIDNDYYCQYHQYPRCSGVLCAPLQYGERKQRPTHTKNRFKSWSCEACQQASCPALAVRRRPAAILS